MPNAFITYFVIKPKTLIYFTDNRKEKEKEEKG